MVSQTIILAICSPTTLKNLGDGIPVFIIHLDAMFLHPVRDDDVRPLDHIPDGMQIRPQCHLEAIAYALVQRHLSARRQVVISACISQSESRQQDFHLPRQCFNLWPILRVTRLFLEEHLQDSSFSRSSLDGNGASTAHLMFQPLCKIRFKGNKDSVFHSLEIFVQR